MLTLSISVEPVLDFEPTVIAQRLAEDVDVIESAHLDIRLPPVAAGAARQHRIATALSRLLPDLAIDVHDHGRGPASAWTTPQGRTAYVQQTCAHAASAPTGTGAIALTCREVVRHQGTSMLSTALQDAGAVLLTLPRSDEDAVERLDLAESAVRLAREAMAAGTELTLDRGIDETVAGEIIRRDLPVDRIVIGRAYWDPVGRPAVLDLWKGTGE